MENAWPSGRRSSSARNVVLIGVWRSAWTRSWSCRTKRSGSTSKTSSRRRTRKRKPSWRSWSRRRPSWTPGLEITRDRFSRSEKFRLKFWFLYNLLRIMRFSDQIMRKNFSRGCCEFYIGKVSLRQQRQNGKTIDYICYVLLLWSCDAIEVELLDLSLTIKLSLSHAKLIWGWAKLDPTTWKSSVKRNSTCGLRWICFTMLCNLELKLAFQPSLDSDGTWLGDYPDFWCSWFGSKVKISHRHYLHGSFWSSIGCPKTMGPQEYS